MSYSSQISCFCAGSFRHAPATFSWTMLLVGGGYICWVFHSCAPICGQCGGFGLGTLKAENVCRGFSYLFELIIGIGDPCLQLFGLASGKSTTAANGSGFVLISLLARANGGRLLHLTGSFIVSVPNTKPIARDIATILGWL